jgi:hypothetical protein
LIAPALRRRNNQTVSKPESKNPRGPLPDVNRGRLLLTQTGDFMTGSAVSAHWGGKWVPGSIQSINPGGFSVMVQLDDPHFPLPIVLSTNQLRLR